MGSISKVTSKRGKLSYVAKIRKKGYPQKCATFKINADAKRWINLNEAIISDERNFGTPPSKKYTFDELADKYIRDIIPKKGAHGATQIIHLKCGIKT